MVDSAKNDDFEPIIFPFGSLFELCAYVKADLKFGKGKYIRRRRDPDGDREKASYFDSRIIPHQTMKDPKETSTIEGWI